MENKASGNAKEVEMEALVIRKDGTLDLDASIIQYWHKNPLKRILWKLKNGPRGEKEIRRRYRQE